jgi:glycosyltransferase involved in cell wall biosynthesis
MLNQGTYLVVTPFFPTMGSHNGSFIYDQINEIRNQANFDIRVIKVVSLFSAEIDYVYDGFNVSILKMVDIPFFVFPGLFNGINKKRILDLLKQAEIESIAMVHGHVTYPSAFLSNCVSNKYECKSIVQHHGLDVLQLMNGRSNFIKKLQRNYLIKKTISQLNKSDLNIGVSELVLNQLKEYSTYCPKDEFVLYNGVDTSKFYQIKGDKNKIYTIGCIANFWGIKDQISLIKAFELLILDGITDIQLKLIGSGKKLEFCKNFVRDHNLSAFIIFEKERQHTVINDFYNDIDLFVLPSYYEALGCVYLESWSTNTPFIAIKNQGISELIPENEFNNLLADEKSPKSLKEKILGEYTKKRNFPFEERYDIKNTIFDFLSLDIFKKYD